MTPRTPFPILLVDGDPDALIFLTQAARSVFEQAQFTAISSFEQAAAYLDDFRGVGPRLILLNPNLQDGQKGLDFLSLLRKHPQGRLVPTIILSADDDPLVSEEAYQRGVNAFTLKPNTDRGWQVYLTQLRSYWYDLVTLPPL